MYSCNLNISSVTRTVKNRCCAANQEGIEPLRVDETESIKQYWRVVRVFGFTDAYPYYPHKVEGVGYRL